MQNFNWFILSSIRFDNIDGFIRVYDGTTNLILFGAEKYNLIYSKQKSKKWHYVCYFS